MKKKFLVMLLSCTMTATLLVGCGAGATEEGVVKEESTVAEVTGEAEKEEVVVDPAEITVAYWSLAKQPEEIDLVEAAINEITEKEMGITVNLNIMDVGTYIPNGAMANGVANGEDFDVVLTAPALAGTFANMSNNGMLMPINDLIEEYGKELKATVPAEFLQATTKDGQILAVPVYGNKVKNQYWVVRKSVAEGAGIDVASIKNLNDVEAALIKIKEAFPNMNPLSGSSRSINVTFPGYAMASGSTYQSFDTLGESTAVAAAVNFEDDTLTAVSRYETAEYVADMELLKKWYGLGLIDKDVATDTATSNVLDEKADAASVFYTGQFNLVETLVKTDEVEYVKIANGSVSTGGLLQFTWAIPVSCDEPEAAMKFLNLLYTDERIVNLIDYGVEGTHYEKKADGTIGFPEGVTNETSGYFMGNITELVGNSYLSHPWEGGDPNKNVKAKAEMDNAVYSPLAGFVFDTSKISDIYAQLCTIANEEYAPALSTGSIPDGGYNKFIDKLYKAGLQEYLDEANRQIQEWKSSK